MKKKALFLDRDGTIMFDLNYLSDPSLVRIIPGSAEALNRAMDLGYLLFLFTNQSGIGRGYFSLETVQRVNMRMEELLAIGRPIFTETCIAPETSEDIPVYRKPSPRFILEMIAKHDLDPALCYMVGDAPADIVAAAKAGIAPVAVATGKGAHPGEFPETREHNAAVFENLLEFVKTLS